VSPKLAFREAGTQVSLVTMSCPKCLCSTLFATVYKRLLKKSLGLLVFAFGFALEGFLGCGFCFELFGVGSFWKGKRITEGKELLKRNC
jgi:hypothetical protein